MNWSELKQAALFLLAIVGIVLLLEVGPVAFGLVP